MSEMRLSAFGHPFRRSAIDGSPWRIEGLPSLIVLALLLMVWRLVAMALSGATLYVDEAQYWVWAQNLEWGYFSKPPGIAALIRLSTALFGDGLLGVKALAMVCYPLSAFIAWLIARRLYGEHAAWWSAVIVMTLPIYAWLGLFASTDALLTVFWLAGIWCYQRVIDRGRRGDWLLLGMVCGLGLLSKYTMLVFMGAVFLHLCAFHRSRLLSFRAWMAISIALAMIAPNVLWNFANDFPTLRHTAEITLQRQSGHPLRALTEFLAAQWLSFGPLPGCVVMLGIWRWRQLRTDPAVVFLLWFALPLWGVVSLQAAMGGANANWAAPAFAPAAIAIAGWLCRQRKVRLAWAGVVINLGLTALAYHAPALLKMADVSHPGRYNPFVRATGWDDLGGQLRPFLKANPETRLLADNRSVLAHMAYELRDLQPRIASWNPQRHASDHFKLTADMGRYAGRDALLVIDHVPEAALTSRFSGARHLGTLTQDDGSMSSRSYEVYLLHEFQGY